MTIEKISASQEFEQNIPKEIERKFLPLFPENLLNLRELSRPIEQLYLSYPDEPFSLRIREAFDESGALTYTATLKDRGTVTTDGLERMEVEAIISGDIYQNYRNQCMPFIRKLRAEPLKGVIVDFYEDGTVRLESENADSWRRFTVAHNHQFVETTGDRSMNSEWLAHLNFRRMHDGAEALTAGEELQAADIVRDVTESLTYQRGVTIHIGGRSGSGKSTVVREVQERLQEYGIHSAVLSTDDYHRGTQWLAGHNNGEAWKDWDAPIVYDTETMAADLRQLKTGMPIPRRKIDWSTAEPVVEGRLLPAPVLIIEGIYALSANITEQDDLTYEMPTPLATCIGRRLLRDLRERPEFADASKSLAYMLEYAEPAYQAQIRART